MLTEHEVELIFRDGLSMIDDIRWASQPSNSNWVQFGSFLDSPRDMNIRLTMGISVRRPEKYKIFVIRGEQMLRRLDVRGSHTNPPRATAGKWTRQTHKHRWTDRFADMEAYTPPDIHVGTFAATEHESTFRSFCTECSIDFRGRWVDPPFTTPRELEL